MTLILHSNAVEAKLTEEVCGAHLDHGDGLIAGVDTELLLDKVKDVIHAGAALAHGHAALHHVEELLVWLRKLDPCRGLKVGPEVLETVPGTVVSPVQAVQSTIRNLGKYKSVAIKRQRPLGLLFQCFSLESQVSSYNFPIPEFRSGSRRR